MIPNFDIHGVVPPIRPGEAGHSLDRAPYPTDMYTFCSHFGTTPERRSILAGLLTFWAELRKSGIKEGFQWLNGSFAEDVERLRQRSPADIDVVTFGVFGTVEEQRARLSRNPKLFDHKANKTTYGVDHYFLPADGQGMTHQAFVRNVSYWYSMWGHQRGTQRWKGFASVLLNSNDEEAERWLDSNVNQSGGAV